MYIYIKISCHCSVDAIFISDPVYNKKSQSLCFSSIVKRDALSQLKRYVKHPVCLYTHTYIHPHTYIQIKNIKTVFDTGNREALCYFYRAFVTKKH